MAMPRARMRASLKPISAERVSPLIMSRREVVRARPGMSSMMLPMMILSA